MVKQYFTLVAKSISKKKITIAVSCFPLSKLSTNHSFLIECCPILFRYKKRISVLILNIIAVKTNNFHHEVLHLCFTNS